MIVRLKKQCKIDIFPKGKLFPEVKIPMGKNKSKTRPGMFREIEIQETTKEMHVSLRGKYS